MATTSLGEVAFRKATATLAGRLDAARQSYDDERQRIILEGGPAILAAMRQRDRDPGSTDKNRTHRILDALDELEGSPVVTRSGPGFTFDSDLRSKAEDLGLIRVTVTADQEYASATVKIEKTDTGRSVLAAWLEERKQRPTRPAAVLRGEGVPFDPTAIAGVQI